MSRLGMKIIPPNMPWPQALRLGYVGEIRMEGYLAWLRTLPCHRCMVTVGIEASHPNFYKSQTRKGPDPLALSECRYHHEAYESAGDPQEAARLARAALFMLQAISEGRLVWKSL